MKKKPVAKKKNTYDRATTVLSPKFVDDDKLPMLSEIAAHKYGIYLNDEVPYVPCNNVDEYIAKDIEKDIDCNLYNLRMEEKSDADDDADDDADADAEAKPAIPASVLQHLDDWIKCLSKLDNDEDLLLSNVEIMNLLYALVASRMQVVYFLTKLREANAKLVNDY